VIATTSFDPASSFCTPAGIERDRATRGAAAGRLGPGTGASTTARRRSCLGGDLLKAGAEALDRVHVGALIALLDEEGADPDNRYQDHDDQIDHKPRSYLVGDFRCLPRTVPVS
jgi:hypothetical protein